MPKQLSPEVEREARRLAAKGHGLREIGRMLACSDHAVTNVLAREPRPLGQRTGTPHRRACRVTSGRRSVRRVLSFGSAIGTLATANPRLSTSW